MACFTSLPPTEPVWWTIQGPDDLMYSEPRLAEHLDLSSLQTLTETYEAIFQAQREALAGPVAPGPNRRNAVQGGLRPGRWVPVMGRPAELGRICHTSLRAGL